MKLLVIFIFVCTTVFAVHGQEPSQPHVRKELLTMDRVDQEARMTCANGTADEQIQCLAKIAETIDAPNTRRLEEIYRQYGLPTKKLVGEDGFKAFMLLLQHCNSNLLREKRLKPIKNAFERKELSPLDYANFTDRLLLHQGKEQIYGSGFEIKDGKLVISKTKDIKNLDKRRAKIGLPPITESMKILKEMYHLEVEAPKTH
jgi:hypothetical protein